MSATLNAQSISGKIGVGNMVLGDYTIKLDQIEGGHRLTVTRGSEVQTMDILDGPQGEKGDTGAVGPQGEPGQDAPQDVVRYAAQSLDTDQQRQARENIGAADSVTVTQLMLHLRGSYRFGYPESQY